jgi:SWI/SNF-related matrix-associated actin-dependent regulator 1 of chromatin subfamily A
VHELFPYQQEGAAWLASKTHALLADEMGLGKSAQAVTAADIIGAERILVCCPASVRINWLREFAKFSTRGLSSTALLTGADTPHTASIVTCSYDLATKSSINSSLRQWLTSTKKTVLVLDESHFLKSVDAARSHAVLARGGLIHHAQRCWALSVAPLHLTTTPNCGLCCESLVYTAEAMTPSLLSFVETRATPHGVSIYGHQNIGEFRQLIQPIMLRRKVEQVMHELPPISFNEVYVQPGPVDLELCFPDYFLSVRDRKDEFNAKLEADKATVAALVGHTGLGADGLVALGGIAKSVSTLRKFTGLQKVQPVVDLLTDEFDGGLDKVVILAHHRDVIENLRLGLSKFKPVTLYGGTSPETRQKNIDKFAKDPKTRVFIGNILALPGVDGLQNMCCNVLMVEPDWVPANNAQAIMRVRRIGQSRPVFVRSVILEGDGLDRRIGQVLRRKTKDLVEADLL